MPLQIRDVRISDQEGAELARRLRAYGDPVGVAVAERLERGLLMGTAVIGTSRPEARVLLTVIEELTPERLRGVANDLRAYLSTAYMPATNSGHNRANRG